MNDVSPRTEPAVQSANAAGSDGFRAAANPATSVAPTEAAQPIQEATPGTPAPLPPVEAGGPVREDPRFGAVRLYLRASRFSDAQVVAEAILKSTPESARAAFYAGIALHKQKLYARARPYLERAAAHASDFPEGPHAIHYVGWCAYYLGDLPAARTAFSLHLNAWPNYDDTHFGLGLVALDEDKLAEAETCFRTAIGLIATQNGRPRERAKNLARLGDVQLRQERVAEAEASYREAVALWRDHHEAWAKLARILDRTDRAAEAEAARREQQAAMDRMTAEGIPWRP